MSVVIRNCTLSDLDRLYEIESLSYPVEEGAGYESIRSRLEAFPNHFWCVVADGEVVAFANGMCTEEEHLQDWMYDDAARHDEEGAWQMVFSVVSHPDHRGHLYARRALSALVEDARAAGRKGLVLTCKESLLGYYGFLGFVDEGISDSTHGGVVWHEMRLTF